MLLLDVMAGRLSPICKKQLSLTKSRCTSLFQWVLLLRLRNHRPKVVLSISLSVHSHTSYYLASAKPEKKVSNAFSNFFTKKADAKKAETPKAPAKAAKEKEVKPVPSIDASKNVNISGVSLILFEEVIFNKFCHFVFMLQSFIKVDVVLEEDKGFWSAVATFIQTTKRPILLTAT
jgi:hypothetical protein